ncbi:MAG: transporter substrate-binding domain-containing protein [Chromatiaceae bacterium]|jgi:membrane-bound lytic murein transglycosylase F
MAAASCLLLAACSEEPVERAAERASEVVTPPPPSVAVPETRKPRDRDEPVVEHYVGDLDAMRARGRLRILTPANIGGVFYLPRDGWPVAHQHEVAEAFAASEGLDAVLVPVERFAGTIPALLEGRGDIIAANLTVTEARREKIAFSVPLTTVKQQALVAHADQTIRSVADLDGKRVMADPSSSFWERLERLRQRYPGIELVRRPPTFSDEDELDAVAAGVVDAALRDSNIAEMYLAYRDDLKLAFELPGTDDIAWGLRHDAPKLRAALNRYMHLEFAGRAQSERHTGDLDEIRERRVLRVLLRNNAASYFLYKGELKGFEYELAKAFAKAKRLRLEVIVPDSHAELIEWLREGRGDIAAGFLEADPNLTERGVAFSRPYHHAPRHLVVRADSPISTPQDLQGHVVTVRRSSPYWKDLRDLQQAGIALDLVAAPEDVETEELIHQVAAGLIEATVADGHLLDIELAREVGVKSAFTISEQRAHSVAVRTDNPKLLAALDEFIKQQYRGVTYNLLYRKYFTNQRTIRDLADGRVDSGAGDHLSPYDDIIRRYAERYGFDWRLITAQMFQESRFDPKAKSFAGARGLLQVMPKTAKFMGFEQLDQPEQNIHAGVKYLDWVRNRFESSLPFDERMWFTLAAYNAGHGHVQDARRLARQKGWDGDRWFDNTENAMLLLSKKQYAGKARHGYVRGIEPVSYVRNIRQRYRAYVELLEERVSGHGRGAYDPGPIADAGSLPR